MPEEKIEQAQASQPDEQAISQTGEAPQEQTQEGTPEQEQPAEEKKLSAESFLPLLYALLAIIFVAELGLLTFIGLNVYRNIQTNRAIEEQNAAIVALRESSGQPKIQYSGPGRTVVDGVLVSNGSDDAGQNGEAAPE